jgi:hypothetical protein
MRLRVTSALPGPMKRSGYVMRARQRGQAVILVAVTAIILLLAALLVYNVGQLNLKKTKLQNTADSAAYSGALLMARSYNFAAYSNRAMVANQVAIAQMVSLASWSRYYCLTFADSDCGDFSTNGTDETIQFGLELIEGGQPGMDVNEAYQGYSSSIFTGVNDTIPTIVKGLNDLEALLSDASRTYYDGTLAELALDAAGTGPMSKVVHDNEPNAGISLFGMGTLGDSLLNVKDFVKVYDPQNRTGGAGNRFHDVTVASMDAWTKSRSGPELPPFTSGLTAVGDCFGDGFGFIIFSGGWHGSTSLDTDNKAWRASDNGYWAGAGVCVVLVDIGVAVIPVPIPLIVPTPPSTGKATAGVPSNTPYDIKTYSGLRKYLDVKNLNDPDMASPSLTIFVRENASHINTTHQMRLRGEAIAGGKLDLADKEADSEMQVGASANAYFARPDANLKLGGYAVYGNLFNPYWEAHLVDTPDATVAAAVAVQGVSP